MKFDAFFGRTLMHCLKVENQRYFLNTSFPDKVLILSALNEIIEAKIKKEEKNDQ